MAQIPREIAGPQEQFERTGPESLRDVRPLTTRMWAGLMSGASGLVLAGAGGVMLLEPATIDLIVPAAIAYAAVVLTRRVTLPLRLPKSSGMKDWNDPDPSYRRARMASGTIYLGRDLKGREIWISPEDGLRHAAIPGTTGAGKTAAILSFLVNALSHASGFVLVDGKGDQKLYGEVLALARRFGREDDVLHLNLLVASGSKNSHRFNPFAMGNSDAIREMVVSQLGDQGGNDTNGVFRSRAVALAGAIAPVLVWIRDNAGIPIDIEKIRDCLELRVIWKLATKSTYELRDSATGKVEDHVFDFPVGVLYQIQSYLSELPGYDTALDYNRQKSEQALQQHGFARFYFTGVFTQLGGSLGHIFKAEQGDIDMRDVVLNRRILVVSLPALENSSDTLAGLGKIVISSLRGMMAQMLDIPPEMLGQGSPFHIVLDELGYYATADLDRMMAQGRSLNIMFWLSFQELSAIYARIGEKMNTLLGNANLIVAMRLQDAERTREWIEKTAGQIPVTQATSYHRDSGGEYSDALQADVRQVARVDWRDLQRLIEGEAIILYGGRRIYAKVFHAKIDTSGPKRFTMPLTLAAPDPIKVKAELARIKAVTSTITRGHVGVGPDEPVTPALQSFIGGFRGAAAAGGDADACVDAGIEAAGKAAVAALSDEAANPLNAPSAEMFQSAVNGTSGPARPAGVPSGKIDPSFFAACSAVEASTGVADLQVRENVLELLAVRERALAEIDVPRPGRASAADVNKAVETLMGMRGGLAERETPAPAPTIENMAGMAP